MNLHIKSDSFIGKVLAKTNNITSIILLSIISLLINKTFLLLIDDNLAFLEDSCFGPNIIGCFIYGVVEGINKTINESGDYIRWIHFTKVAVCGSITSLSSIYKSVLFLYRIPKINRLQPFFLWLVYIGVGYGSYANGLYMVKSDFWNQIIKSNIYFFKRSDDLEVNPNTADNNSKVYYKWALFKLINVIILILSISIMAVVISLPKKELYFSFLFVPLGCICRYYLSFINKKYEMLNKSFMPFPGTFFANFIACIIIWLTANTTSTSIYHIIIYKAIDSGFCVGLSSFSSFIYEIAEGCESFRISYFYALTSLVFYTTSIFIN